MNDVYFGHLDQTLRDFESPLDMETNYNGDGKPPDEGLPVLTTL